MTPLVWTPKETALALASTLAAVRRLTRAGVLRSVEIDGQLRYRPADVQAYVDGLTGETTVAVYEVPPIYGQPPRKQRTGERRH